MDRYHCTSEWATTRSEAAVGTAISTPTKPSSVPPTSRAIRTKIGERFTDLPSTRGVMKTASIACTLAKTMTVPSTCQPDPLPEARATSEKVSAVTKPIRAPR